MAKIKLIAGHGGKDPGAVANGKTEAEIVLGARNLIAQKLELHNYRTDRLAGTRIQVDTDDDNAALASVIQAIRQNARPEDLLLDIHLNAATPQAAGTECFVKVNASGRERNLAARICEATARILGIPNRGVKLETATRHQRLGILHTGVGTSVLWEIFFLTNPIELAKYEQKREQLATEIAFILAEEASK
jgi:N-acetylmuramoyl-L-alanine amidase